MRFSSMPSNQKDQRKESGIMARLGLSSAFSRAFGGLFHGAANRRARRALGWKSSSTRPAGSSRRRVRPCLEMLEDRITPTTSPGNVFTASPTAADGAANSLRAAINAANADTQFVPDHTDTIQLTAGTYQLTLPNTAGNEEENKSGDLNIDAENHNLVIQGAVDANGKPTTIIQQTVADRVFHITDGQDNIQNVLFKNLIIEGGAAKDDGQDGTVAGSSNAQGGGIMVEGGGAFSNKGGQAGVDVTLSNVVLQSNTASAGAGFSAQGGGIFVLGGTLNIQNSIIQHNGAFGGAGGGTNGNAGSAAGGGVFGTGSNISISGSVVSNNTIAGGNASNGNGGSAAGGGVSGGDVNATDTGGLLTSLTLTNSGVFQNTVIGGNAANGGIGGAAEGGSVFASCSATINGSNLVGNKLTGGTSSNGRGGGALGGGVYSADTSFGPGALTITASDLSHNTLTGGTGTIPSSTIGHLSSVSNSSSNITPGDIGGEAAGGGVWSSSSGTTSITGSSMEDNALTGGDGTLNNVSASFSGDVGGEALGGGVLVENVSATITQSNLLDNNLQGGNGTYVAGTVTGTIGGSASGGGVDVSTSGGATPVIALSDSTLSGNFALGGNGSISKSVNGTGGIPLPGFASGGGARFEAGSTADIVNSTIADNQAIGGQNTSNSPVAAGGGLFFDKSSSGNFTNVTVVGNQANPSPTGQGSTSGGGIDNANLPAEGIVTLVNTLVADNGANLGPDFFGTASNTHNNLISDADGSSGFSTANGDQLGSTLHFLNPGIGGLANNGGPTQTIALLSGSPAINAGDNNAASVTGKFDQRGQGFARVANGTIDIGAFEVQPPTLSPPLVSPSPPPSPPPPPPPPHVSPPPTLHTPSLLAFFDALLQGVEKVNGNGTETVTDSFFGIPLFVSTYDSSGNLTSVTMFGINVTVLFEQL
jgi:hypothetical protein